MKDISKLKEKREIRLDNRDIFMFILGACVWSCIIFALGVIVGKKQFFDSSVSSDPLLALDKALFKKKKKKKKEPKMEEEFKFHTLLTQDGNKTDLEKKEEDEKKTEQSLSSHKKLKVCTSISCASSNLKGESPLYTLQVSSFKEREEAVEFLKTLKEAGHPCFIVSVDVPERGRIYRVRVGPFSNVKEAREYQKEFEQKEGMLTFLVRRRLP